MAIDITGLAGAIAVMRATVADTDSREGIASPAVLFAADMRERRAGRALLTALDGIPERVAALEELAARALVFSESFRYLSDNYTHCNCPRFDEDAQDSFEGALVALAALGETDGD